MVNTSSAELLDVVDADDHVVETLTRGEIHRRQLTHRSVHVLVFSDQGSLLLQKRSMLKDECGGMWDTSCAGHVESGQSYEETAPRELLEELGLEHAKPLIELFKMQPTDDNGREFAKVYRTENNGPFTVAADEIDEIKWFEPAQLDIWVAEQIRIDADGENGRTLTSGFCEIWKRYRQEVDH
ncbi:hypothetical protein AB833_25190 [Chromatiales bacterium (ex Bugula neritina AB1)]|nr:hypothetical protein AB833_25190 [Chromatiales bacterium (ex Bugula neritina AB1)]